MFQGVRFGLGLDLSYKYGTTVSSDPNSWDVSGLNLQSGLYTKQYWGYFNDDNTFFNDINIAELGTSDVGYYQITRIGDLVNADGWAESGFSPASEYDRLESLSEPFPAVGKGVYYFHAGGLPIQSLPNNRVGPALKSKEVASIVYGNYSNVPNNESLIIRGYFKPDVSGLYTFKLASDDASYLWLGPNAFDVNRFMGNSVVSVPGQHPVQESTGTFNMVAGLYYPLTIEFGNGPAGGGVLLFEYLSPGSSVYSSNLTGKIWSAAGTSGHGQESMETVITYTDSNVESFDIAVIPDNWQISNSNIVSALIGNNVTSIGQYAFQSCAALTSITIPDSVTSIGQYAFQSCSALTSITIPDNVTFTGEGAFAGCTSLTSITIPNNVTSISEYMFYSCTSLTSITIPNNVTSIGNLAFYYCTSLTSITIPNSVTSIGDEAFAYCTSLNTLNCYVARSVIDVSTTLVGTASPFTIYARASDSTWTAGSDTIGGKTVTVVKNL